MKKQLKLICMVTLLAAVVILITACGKWGDTYAQLDESGYSVSVRFDANGGMFEGANDVFVVDVFNLETLPTNAEGKKYTYLMTPDDERRKTSQFEVSNSGYFLAGWYAVREPRVNEENQPLDAYGELCSVSGKPQGYTYGERWDFSKPLTLDANKTYAAQENCLTLYAAWIPEFTFEIYTKDAASGAMTLATSTKAINLNLPAWNETTGKMDMKNFPTIEGKTFDGVYTDEAMTESASGTQTGEWSLETGVATKTTIKLYTTWLDGTWYRISTAKQFKDNSRLNGNYILCADIDFSDLVWAPTLTTGEFTGQIIGNGHKISNVSVEQADFNQAYGGIFGALGATAKITDVIFENITYKIGVGSRIPNASFGLLTGQMQDGTVIENVAVSGELIIGKNIYADGNYAIGLVCGSEMAHGIDFTLIKATSEDESVLGIVIEEGSDRVNLGFNG